MYSSLYLVLALTTLNYQFSTSEELPKVSNAIHPPNPSAVTPAVSRSANLCSTSGTGPASTSGTPGNDAGTCLSIGPFTSFAHNLSTAKTFILNKRQVLIKTVWYDGEGPAAYWIVSNSDKVLKSRPNLASTDYTVIPDESGSTGIVKPYTGQDVLLTLSEPLSFNAVKYISMYCVTYDHNFGYVKIPEAINVPDFTGSGFTDRLKIQPKTSPGKTKPVAGTKIPYNLGNFTPFAHNFTTAETTILNEKQVLITNVWYDGLGPAAYWIVSKSKKTLEERPNYLTSTDYTNIRDETGSCGVLKAYKGQDVTLTLPGNLSFSSLQYISMYCVQFDHNFGYIRIPDSISLPDYTGIALTDCDPIERTMSSLEIVLIVLGVLAALGIVAAIAFTLYRKKQQSYNRH